MPAISTARKEAAIREHAYFLWEQDGRPHGRDVDFWERADREIAALSKRTRPVAAAAASNVKTVAQKPAKTAAPRVRTSAPKIRAERAPKA